MQVFIDGKKMDLTVWRGVVGRGGVEGRQAGRQTGGRAGGRSGRAKRARAAQPFLVSQSVFTQQSRREVVAAQSSSHATHHLTYSDTC